MESGRRISPVFLSLDAEKEGLCDSFLAFLETPFIHLRTTVTMPPIPHRRAHRPIRWVLRRDRNPRVSSQRKAKTRWNPHGLLSRRFFGKPNAAKEAFFPSTRADKIHNNRGCWAKTPTAMEVIEPFLLAEGIGQARRVDAAIGFPPRDGKREPVSQKPDRQFSRTIGEGEEFSFRILHS